MMKLRNAEWLHCAVLCFGVLALSVLGARFQNNQYIFAMIGGVIAIIGLAGFSKLKEVYYPYLLGAVGLALLLQTTLMGPGIMGSDIHTEYYFYNESLDGWDITFNHQYNTAIGSTVIAPFLTNVFHIPGYWIYKVIYPFLFAFVPVLLYFVFKKEFGAKVAFLSTTFFLIVPTWSMEMISLPRQMLGELMFALCLFLVIVSKWKMRIKVPLLIVAGTLGAMFHYVTGPIILLYLGISCLFLLFFRRRKFPVKWLSLVVVLLLMNNVTYYGLVAEGAAFDSITDVSTGYVSRVLHFIHVLPSDYTNEHYSWLEATGEVKTETEETEIETKVKTETGYMEKMSPMLKTAWGADFGSANIWGKVFRIFQYVTQLCIVVGCFCLVKDREKYSAEYLSFCASSVLLLSACVFIPKFADLINATRFYHIVLFLLAPVFILGGQAIFRNFKALTICLIIPYFLFTSGFVFEATQQTDIGRVNMPYSVSLSNYRVDMIGVFTSNDIAVRDWADDNISGWIYADTHSYLLLAERHLMVPYWSIPEGLTTGVFRGGRYFFLSERNTQWGILSLRPGEYEEIYLSGPTSGLRVSYSYAEIGMDKVIAEGKIIYRRGDAFILEMKEARQ